MEEKIYYFDSTETINAVFAYNLTRNLKIAEEKLGVTLVSRDSWIKLTAVNKEILQKSFAFIKALHNSYKTLLPNSLSQKDFDIILSSYVNTKHTDELLENFFLHKIVVGKGKRPIIPRTENQLNYINQIREKELVFGIGPAGTGKTYLAMAMAVSEMLEEKYSRIILTRPAKEAGENLGFLPGTLEEKVLPYLRPLYDALYDMLDFKETETLIEKNIIEIAPMAFMRGRTLNNAFVILDEAQNATIDQMLMLLTRLGFNSHCVVTGDPSQTDLPKHQTSGLAHAAEILKNIDEIGVVYFSAKDIVRHPLVEKIVKAYEKSKRHNSPNTGEM